jgi:hypothetical protein
MEAYPCPEWLKRRRITDAEYAGWLDSQAVSIWAREKEAGKTACASRADLKRALHRAASESDGRDPYSGRRFFVKHMRAGWTDPHAHLKGNRHHRTICGSMPSFDHVKGLGKKTYELCTRETNSAKSYMSPAQFIDFCRSVVRYRLETADMG